MSSGLQCRFVVTVSNKTLSFNFDHAYLIAKDQLTQSASGINDWVYNGDFEYPVDSAFGQIRPYYFQGPNVQGQTAETIYGDDAPSGQSYIKFGGRGGDSATGNRWMHDIVTDYENFDPTRVITMRMFSKFGYADGSTYQIGESSREARSVMD